MATPTKCREMLSSAPSGRRKGCKRGGGWAKVTRFRSAKRSPAAGRTEPQMDGFCDYDVGQELPPGGSGNGRGPGAGRATKFGEMERGPGAAMGEHDSGAGVARAVSHFFLAWGGAGAARACPVPPGAASPFLCRCKQFGKMRESLDGPQ
eukprot:gene23229-biopygen17798